MIDWSQIVHEHGPMVWRTVHRLVNHEADAADCFQRTFMSALELSQIEAIRNWPGLLKRLATARALDCLRQRQREWNRWTTLRDRLPIDRKTMEPVLAAETSELADHLRQALSELDDRQAQVFCLACLEGCKTYAARNFEHAAQASVSQRHLVALRAQEDYIFIGMCGGT